MSDEPPITLEYAPCRKNRRRWWRLALLLFIIIGLGHAFRYRKPIMSWAQLRFSVWLVYRAQQPLLSYVQSPEKIVYDESGLGPSKISAFLDAQTAAPTPIEPAAARGTALAQAFEDALKPRILDAERLRVLNEASAQLVAKGARAPRPLGNRPSAQLLLAQQLSLVEKQIRQLTMPARGTTAGPIGPIGGWGTTPRQFPGTRAVVFLHERVNSAGERRMVMITAEPAGLRAVVYTLAERTKLPRPLLDYFVFALAPAYQTAPVPLPITAGTQVSHSPLRLYAGQPDPADNQRFTIRFEIGDRTGVITGILRDDARLEMAAPGWLQTRGVSGLSLAPIIIWCPSGSGGFEPFEWHGKPQALNSAPVSTDLTSTAIGFVNDHELVVADAEQIRIVDVRSDRIIATFPIGPDDRGIRASVVSCLPAGKGVILWNEPNRAQLIDPLSGRTLWRRSIQTTGAKPFPLTYSLDGSRIFAQMSEQDQWRLEEYDSATGEGPRTLLELSATDAAPFMTNSRYDPADNTLFAADKSNLHRYRIDTGIRESIPASFSFSPSLPLPIVGGGDRIAVFDSRGVQVFSMSQFRKLAQYDLLFSLERWDDKTILQLSPDAKSIVAVEPRVIYIIRPENDQVIRLLRSAEVLRSPPGAISPDGRTLVFHEKPGELTLYDLTRDVDPPMARLKP